MNTRKNKQGGSRTRTHTINGKKTTPITRSEARKKKNNSNNSKKHYFNRLYNRFFGHKKTVKISPIQLPATSIFQTKRSRSSSSQRRKIKALASSLANSGMIGYNRDTGIIYKHNV
jgi:hypothetical protein